MGRESVGGDLPRHPSLQKNIVCQAFFNELARFN